MSNVHQPVLRRRVPNLAVVEEDGAPPPPPPRREAAGGDNNEADQWEGLYFMDDADDNNEADNWGEFFPDDDDDDDGEEEDDDSSNDGSDDEMEEEEEADFHFHQIMMRLMMECMDVHVLDASTFCVEDRLGHGAIGMSNEPILTFLQGHDNLEPTCFENVSVGGHITKMLEQNPDKLEALIQEIVTTLPRLARFRVHLPSRIPCMKAFFRLLKTHIFPRLLAVNEKVVVKVESDRIMASELGSVTRMVQICIDEEIFAANTVDANGAAPGSANESTPSRRTRGGCGGGLDRWYDPILHELLDMPNLHAVKVSSKCLANTFQKICSTTTLVSLTLSDINTTQDRFEFVTLMNALTPTASGRKRKRSGGLVNVGGKLANLESLRLYSIVMDPASLELLRVTMLSTQKIHKLAVYAFTVVSPSNDRVADREVWEPFLSIFKNNKTITALIVDPDDDPNEQYVQALKDDIYKALVTHNHTIQDFYFGFSPSNAMEERLELNAFGLASITGPSCTRERFQKALIGATQEGKPGDLFPVLFRLFQWNPHLVAFLE